MLTALGIKMCVYVDNDKEEREREKKLKVIQEKQNYCQTLCIYLCLLRLFISLCVCVGHRN